MRLGWLRRSSRLVAAVVLLMSLWQLPHQAQDDRICVPAAEEAHDESKHVFRPADGADHQDHCAICHWLRSLKPGSSTRPAALSAADTGARWHASASADLRDPGADRLPARAPPADIN